MTTIISPPTPAFDLSGNDFNITGDGQSAFTPSDPSFNITGTQAFIIPPSDVALKPAPSFLDNFVNMSDDFGSWLSHPWSGFVSFADNAGAAASTAYQLPGEIAAGTGEAIGNVADAANQALKDEAKKLMPWALGGGALLIFLLASNRGR